MDAAAPLVAEDVVPPAEPLPERLPFRFVGSGQEYFRIWIVNLVLSVLTLGIYSAWAKVRRQQYFYRCTELDGSGFEYHGRPLPILFGRIIALVLLVGYKVSAQISGWLFGAFVVLLAFIGPALFRNALRFRLRNSSYRGIRFRFEGSVADAYLAVFAGPLTMLLASLLGIVLYMLVTAVKPPHAFQVVLGVIGVAVAMLFIYGVAFQALKNYQHDNAWFGTTPFHFELRLPEVTGVFFRTGLVALGTMLVVMGALVFIGFLFHDSLGIGGNLNPPKAAAAKLGGLVIVAYIAMLIVPAAFWRSRIEKLVWGASRLGEHRFECLLPVRGLLKLYAINFLLIVLTLGFYSPWAWVRTARFRLEHMALLPAAPLDTLTGLHTADVGALGEEVGGLFDVDLGW